MKPLLALTRLGRLRRMRQVAMAALEAYGLDGTEPHFVREAGNTLYRVRDPRPVRQSGANDVFEPGQYLLRIYSPAGSTLQTVELELTWLAAMRREAGLPVPEPVPSQDGRLWIQVPVPGTAEQRTCALLLWVKGRYSLRQCRVSHYRAQGRLMARMHNFASQWQVPASLVKRQYDWNGLFMNDAEIGLAAGESWKHLPQAWIEPFQSVARQFRALSEGWSKAPQVYGLIHADLGVDANVLFWRGEPRLIEFEAAGLGYWMYDLSKAVEHVRENPAFPHYWDALISGYVEYRSLPEWQMCQRDLFLAAFSVYWCLWATGLVHIRPAYAENLRPRLERESAWVRQYLERQG